MANRRRHAGGFTLVETLAAGTILALAGALLSLAVRQGLRQMEMSRDLQIAAQLSDEVLTKVDTLGPAALLNDGPTEGVFRAPHEKFSWAADIVPAGDGDLYDVTVTIQWLNRGAVRSIEMQTLLNDVSDSSPALVRWEDL